MTHASLHPQPQPQTLPVHATTPGFAIAKAWSARHKPALAVADAPPLLPFEEFEDGYEEPPQPLRRDALPLELTLILTFARALQAVGGQRPGAPAQLALVHGWGAGMVMQLDKLLRDDAIARAFLVPARDRPKILVLAQDGSSESVRADRRKSLARQIAPGSRRSCAITSMRPPGLRVPRVPGSSVPSPRRPSGWSAPMAPRPQPWPAPRSPRCARPVPRLPRRCWTRAK